MEGNTKSAILVVTYERWHTTTYIGVSCKLFFEEMNFNDRLKDRFQFEVEKSNIEIFQHVSERKKTYSWSDLLTESIDFNEVIINKDELVINRRPAFFSPFRSNGKIVFKVTQSGSMSILDGETSPYYGFSILLMVLFFIFLSIWTAGVLLLTAKLLNALLIVSFAWMIFGLLLFLIYTFQKRGLRNYAKKFVTELSGNTKASS